MGHHVGRSSYAKSWGLGYFIHIRGVRHDSPPLETPEKPHSATAWLISRIKCFQKHISVNYFRDLREESFQMSRHVGSGLKAGSSSPRGESVRPIRCLVLCVKWQPIKRLMMGSEAIPCDKKCPCGHVPLQLYFKFLQISIQTTCKIRPSSRRSFCVTWVFSDVWDEQTAAVWLRSWQAMVAPSLETASIKINNRE